MCQCQICDFSFDIEDNRTTFYGDQYFDGYTDEAVRQIRIDEANWLAENIGCELSGKTYMEIGPGLGHFMEGLKKKCLSLN